MPMNSNIRKKPRVQGFALVISLSLMVLLTVLAVGLLSLSAISLRSSTSADASAQAYANARMAVLLAIGELQKNAGDDRRITADASLSANAPQPNLVGVWTSWSPDFAIKADKSAPNYGTEKTNRFRNWLTSSPDPSALKDPKWSETSVGSDWIRLFSLNNDGFDLKAAPVPMESGTFAWTVSQENTKAKVNVAGPDQQSAVANVELQAQSRPSLALASNLKSPEKGWNLRASRVISANQIGLDTDLAEDTNKAAAAGASYTVHGQGLLTNVVKGGLKTDLNLGFELNDSEFARSTWSGTPNPFRAGNSLAGFSGPTSYKGQQPLFFPIVENPIVSILTDFTPASVSHRFYAAGVPTFDHLRSFYRIPYHLYGGNSPPTVAERGPDHVAISIPPASGGSFFSPAAPPNGVRSNIGVRPVLNRLIFLLSIALGGDDQVRLVMTPVISLWNPYNAALEIEGAVAYPWIDVPFQLDWEIKSGGAIIPNTGVGMSRIMGRQFDSAAYGWHGRQVDPYFLCQMTGDGTGTVTKPIRFEPGEIRVFAPATTVPVDFKRLGANTLRTLRMRPVDNINQMTTKGGLTIPMRGGIQGNGFDVTIKQGDTVKLNLRESNPTLYNYFVSLEDAARIKNPADTTRGQAVSEVQMLNFVSVVNNITSPILSYAELKNSPQPFGVLETFARTAKVGLGGTPISDPVYTTNPRHAATHHQLARGSFTVAPHYLSTLRAASSFDGAIQTANEGRRSFWGPSNNSSTGQTLLPFFEIPRQPLVSLAGFQHAELASSTFSSANQFGNSWASPYLGRNRAGIKETTHVRTGVPIYDTPYLTNEALWDSFFFSGAAPTLRPGSSGNPQTAWANTMASTQKSLSKVMEDFVADPLEKPLSNSRMRLIKGSYSDSELVKRLLEPEGCTRIAAHLAVDGAFNINSTSVEAWTAFLSGLRGQDFEVEGGNSPSGSDTSFPRFRFPSQGGTGSDAKNWNGFRSLSDGQIRQLADNIVQQVRLRGPFLSLAEFVNRRIENSDLGRSGAIQSAIDKARFNDSAKQAVLPTSNYPGEARSHIIPDTSVGIPGYLTQADVLQSLAPVITARSDTFTVRGYGEAKDANGNVIARAWCEAVVQRVPEFIDPTTPAESAIASATPVNQTFGRRFEIVSFRRLHRDELL